MSDKPAGADKKIAAGVCGILLGALGIHKFILGYTKEGIIMLLVTILTLCFGGFIMGIIGTVLWVLGVLFYVVMIGFGMAASTHTTGIS